VRTELELRHLRVFVTVVDEGSHTRAARSLGLSQSTVSETLSALERTLGTVLLRKGGKAPALTRSGEALLPYARRMLALSGEAINELAKVSTDVQVTLCVTAVESLSAYVLPSHLSTLHKRWPKAHLEVITGTCAAIRESVASGKSDLGLVLEVEKGPTDGGAVVANARLVIVASPAHPFAQKTVSPDELRRCDFLMCDSGGDYHHILRHHFDDAGVPFPRTRALGTVEGVKRGIVAGGSALGLLPAHAIAHELRSGLLAEVGVQPALRGLVLRAVRSSEKSSSPIVDALLQSLRASPLAT
jgi:DNA-binding transcriptional LysR family regulator